MTVLSAPLLEEVKCLARAVYERRVDAHALGKHPVEQRDVHERLACEGELKVDLGHLVSDEEGGDELARPRHAVAEQHGPASIVRCLEAEHRECILQRGYVHGSSCSL